MTIYYDSHVKIAHGKKICQDFATSGWEEVPYGVLADGCSNAPDSESGAQDLVNSLESYLYTGCNFQNAFMGACGRADALRSIRSKGKPSLYATLLCIIEDEGMLRAAIGGDGFEVFRRRGTNIYEICHTEFSYNSPTYPIYFLTPDMVNYAAFCKIKDNYRIETNMVLDVRAKEFIEQPWKEEHKASLVCCATDERDLENYDLGLIFSDGLDSFKDEKDNTIPLLDVLSVFLNFKLIHGEFLQRTMNNFAWEEVARRGWRNTDDFSVAGISHVNDERERSITPATRAGLVTNWS